MTPASKLAAHEPERLERIWILTFCAIGAGLALGFYLARSGQMLLLEWVGIVQPGLAGYFICRELGQPRPRLRLVAFGSLFALMTCYFGISPAVRLLALLATPLPCAAAMLRRFRLARVLTVAYCTMLVGAKIHTVFGPPTAWL